MFDSSSAEGRSDLTISRPPLLLRVLPGGFALAGLFILAEGIVALAGGGEPLSFLRQEVTGSELMSLLLPRAGLLLAGAGFLTWALEHRPPLFRDLVIALPALLFILGMVSASLVGYPLLEAWQDIGWRPLTTALSLAALVYGSGESGRYLSRFDSPRLVELPSRG